jgi:uncharacterized membrane protein YhiD involved in acid resistance
MGDMNALAPSLLSALVLNLGIGLILSLLVAWYYEHYGESLSNRHKFAQLLPVLTLTTAIVISIIKSSLALSLGLVGALSIVRFRTAVKEPEELLFLFIALTIGLGVGADQRWLTVIGTTVVLGYMAARMLISRKSQVSNLYLNISVEENAEQNALFSQVNARLLEHASVVDFRRLDSRDGVLQLTYFIHCHTPQALNDIIDDLKRHFPIFEISFIQQDQVLGG